MVTAIIYAKAFDSVPQHQVPWVCLGSNLNGSAVFLMQDLNE